MLNRYSEPSLAMGWHRKSMETGPLGIAPSTIQEVKVHYVTTLSCLPPPPPPLLICKRSPPSSSTCPRMRCTRRPSCWRWSTTGRSAGSRWWASAPSRPWSASAATPTSSPPRAAWPTRVSGRGPPRTDRTGQRAWASATLSSLLLSPLFFKWLNIFNFFLISSYFCSYLHNIVLDVFICMSSKVYIVYLKLF